MMCVILQHSSPCRGSGHLSKSHYLFKGRYCHLPTQSQSSATPDWFTTAAMVSTFHRAYLKSAMSQQKNKKRITCVSLLDCRWILCWFQGILFFTDGTYILQMFHFRDIGMAQAYFQLEYDDRLHCPFLPAIPISFTNMYMINSVSSVHMDSYISLVR